MLTYGLMPRLLGSLLVGFIVGQFIGWCYMWSHRGVSYTRTFTQSLILIAMVSSMSMVLVTTNVLGALGLLGGLALIRFRTVVRDARDTTFVLISLVAGMASGLGFYLASVVGTGLVCLAALYLHRVGFGSWRALDSVLRFEVVRSRVESPDLSRLLREFCRRVDLVSVDDVTALVEGQPERCQCAFKIRMRHPEMGAELVAALRERHGADAVHLLVQQEHEEVA
jgi:hypothetical protein